MTKAAELAKMGEVLTNSQIGGRRNIIINGAMEVAQRGTSFTLENNSAKYPVDRIFIQDVNSSAGEATVSQSTTAPTDFKNSLKIDVTTADTSLVAADQYKIEYRIEGQDIAHLNFGTSSAKTVTLSFYIRSNKTGNTSVALLNNGNDRAYVATFTIDSANTFERKEITIEGDQSGTWLDTNGIGLRLRWGSYGSTYQTSSVNQWVGSQVMSTDSSPINFFDSTDNELYITGLQLEVGSQATPFEHRSFGEELALCQRYCYRLQGATYTRIGAGFNPTSTNNNCVLHTPTAMRANLPSVTTSSLSGTSTFKIYHGSASLATVSAIAVESTGSDVDSCVILISSTTSGVTAGSAGLLVTNNNTAAFLELDSEL